MIKEAAKNTIELLKDILNERSKIVERHKRKLLKALQNIMQDT